MEIAMTHSTGPKESGIEPGEAAPPEPTDANSPARTEGHENSPHGHRTHDRETNDHGGHGHAAMVADFRRRFWISPILTVPILSLSPLIQGFVGLEGRLDFAGDRWALFALASAVYFHGGWPFLTGLLGEVRKG
jgi:Cu2+-exporting ATPase